MRALEVYQSTGKRLSDWQKEHAFHEQPFDVLKIGLNRERGQLYDLINRRSERMVEAGFLEEVRGLVRKGYSLSLKPLSSVGYRQMGQVVRGLARFARRAGGNETGNPPPRQAPAHLVSRQ